MSERCKVCDRDSTMDGCPALQRFAHGYEDCFEEVHDDCAACVNERNCSDYAVDWRARCLAAEATLATVTADNARLVERLAALARLAAFMEAWSDWGLHRYVATDPETRRSLQEVRNFLRLGERSPLTVNALYEAMEIARAALAPAAPAPARDYRAAVTFRIFRHEDGDGLTVHADGPHVYGDGTNLDAAMAELAEEIRDVMATVNATPDEQCAPDLLEIKRKWGWLATDGESPAPKEDA